MEYVSVIEHPMQTPRINPRAKCSVFLDSLQWLFIEQVCCTMIRTLADEQALDKRAASILKIDLVYYNKIS